MARRSQSTRAVTQGVRALRPPRHAALAAAAIGLACVAAKQDDRAFADWHVVSVGPALGGRAFPADWLAKKLADPTSVRSTVASDAPMPNLALSPAEIDALVQYVNHRHGLAARGGAQ